jgi:diguanylate cyclase (GGDEF)-like protein
VPLKDLTLLFVEDNRDAQEHIEMLLEDDVKELYQAFDGKEGLALYKEKVPDIVITDINLPYLNGLDLTSAIKKIDPTQPIMIMSAFDDKENILNSINLGSSGFITKPIDVDLLFQRLHAIADTVAKEKKKSKATSKQIEELYNLAHYDRLTQIPNKFMFDKEFHSYFKEAKEENREFALLFIDFDKFKTINDTYGHEAGDFVLKSMTSNILKAISKNDILSRRSGDEFLVLLRNYATQDDIKQIVYTILQFTSKEIIWNNTTIKSSCSIGISQFPSDATQKKELLTLADVAMYNAKELGGGHYFFAHDNNDFELEMQNKNTLVPLSSELFWHKKHTQLIYKDKEIPLTKKEHLFLSLLFSSANYQATYEQIYIYLWGNEYLHKKENVKTLVKTLRKKIPKDFIVNIFGIGYKILQE